MSPVVFVFTSGFRSLRLYLPLDRPRPVSSSQGPPSLTVLIPQVLNVERLMNHKEQEEVTRYLILLPSFLFRPY